MAARVSGGLARLALPRADSLANPAGSRTRAISPDRLRGTAAASSHLIPGRRTSAQISCIRPVPRDSPAVVLPSAILPASSSHRMTGRRQSARPSAPAPDASHLSCQVPPGCAASQSRTLISPNLRCCRASALPKANGGASSRSSTAARLCPVMSQETAAGRGGNLSRRAALSALGSLGPDSLRQDRAPAVTTAACRTGRSAPPAGSQPPAAPGAPPAPRPGAGDGR